MGVPLAILINSWFFPTNRCSRLETLASLAGCDAKFSAHACEPATLAYGAGVVSLVGPIRRMRPRGQRCCGNLQHQAELPYFLVQSKVDIQVRHLFPKVYIIVLSLNFILSASAPRPDPRSSKYVGEIVF
jgi:hypothetical protein